jgi:hypothetical protein
MANRMPLPPPPSPTEAAANIAGLPGKKAKLLRPLSAAQGEMFEPIGMQNMAAHSLAAANAAAANLAAGSMWRSLTTATQPPHGTNNGPAPVDAIASPRIFPDTSAGGPSLQDGNQLSIWQAALQGAASAATVAAAAAASRASSQALLAQEMQSQRRPQDVRNADAANMLAALIAFGTTNHAAVPSTQTDADMLMALQRAYGFLQPPDLHRQAPFSDAGGMRGAAAAPPSRQQAGMNAVRQSFEGSTMAAPWSGGSDASARLPAGFGAGPYNRLQGAGPPPQNQCPAFSVSPATLPGGYPMWLMPPHMPGAFATTPGDGVNGGMPMATPTGISRPQTADEAAPGARQAYAAALAVQAAQQQASFNAFDARTCR